MLILSLIFGCDDHEFTGGGHHSGGETTGEGYAAVQSIFSNNCTNCHATGATFPSLDGDLCTDLVNVDSQQTSNKLIVAGDSDSSYLYHKMAGTHLDIGGSGSQMPIGGSISQADVDLVMSWIDEGASCEGGSDTPSDPVEEPSNEPSDDSGNPESTTEPSSEPIGDVFWTDIEPKVGACSGCHSDSGTFPPINYDDLVDQDSMQLSSMKLIAPSDPENSYLLHKISGTHLDVGGSGVQMPMGTPALSPEDIALVEAWIVQGALLE